MSIESIIAEMKAEAEEMGRNRGLARIMSGDAASQISERRSRIRQEEEARANAKQDSRHEAMKLIQDRDPCIDCGTRKDLHDEFGCRRWRG